MTISKEDDLLTSRDFYALVNNVLMKGSFSGDAIHEAADLMSFCLKMVEALDAHKELNSGK